MYVGATGNLKERIEPHFLSRTSLFTKKYNITELIYFEEFSVYQKAFIREKQIKIWRNEWKWNLVITQNPELKNLYLEL